MAPLQELEAAFGRWSRDRRLSRRARRSAAHLRGTSHARHASPTASPRGCGRSADRLEARGPAPHRRAQAQQRARPGPAGDADAQAARSSRRRAPGSTASPRRRRRHGSGCPCRVYMGVDGHGAPGAERRPHAPARRRGRRRRLRIEDAEGRDQRGHARLDRERRDDALRARLGARSAPVPDDRPRVPVGHRPRGARAVPQARRPGSAGRGRVRRRRLQRDRTLLRVPLLARRRCTASRPAGAGPVPASTRPASPAAPPASFTARARCSCRTSDGQILPTHSVSAGLDYPAVGPEHAALHDSGRVRYGKVSDAEALDAFALLSETEGIVPALESRACDRVRGEARPAHAAVRVDPRQPLGPRRQGPRRVPPGARRGEGRASMNEHEPAEESRAWNARRDPHRGRLRARPRGGTGRLRGVPDGRRPVAGRHRRARPGARPRRRGRPRARGSLLGPDRRRARPAARRRAGPRRRARPWRPSSRSPAASARRRSWRSSSSRT